MKIGDCFHFFDEHGAIQHQGIIRGIDGDRAWVELFSFLDGSLLAGRRSLHVGDGTRWVLFDSDKEMRRAYTRYGYERGLWGYDEVARFDEWDEAWQRFMSGQIAESARPATPKQKRNERREKFRASLTNGRRFKLLERDGFCCRYCGSRVGLEIDHVVPLAAGGSDADDNLVTACRNCNNGKRARLISVVPPTSEAARA